ncbi:YolD-like family protein [Bacillus paralicheniformis]|uniref:YolD-like family protein n=1 Tax=Bacillus paralicheniformis TaxID=1648923 RepID=UPI002DBBEB1A|nr:YolD-like family protein [Bacillus paralicheniformis]MEC1050890.1 YolD-like family protein [Bacillus paralicheniformis]MEC1087736.1 YolD-like family protein [Bacillus paralicheniformis]MEC1108805.1 YolD-like family protein [Bacillus paralicheniformis]MEC1150273.1 YolD-like family protein [Bacillus paralicheniformis]MEC1171312.1 YolD-like family protein [Bacillus paralicheniformis]
MRENLKDRGTIKWTSMMLPEHVKLLRELKDSQNRSKRPVLDAAQLDDMEIIIYEAMANDCMLHFEVFKAKTFLNSEETGDIIHLEGKIHYINHQKKTFHIVDLKGNPHFIKFKDLIGVSRL